MRSDLKRAKARAWRYFSEFIRTRDCLETTKTPFSAICCTCNKEIPFSSKLHAGHFKAGRTNSVLFEETNVHAQCLYCNTYLHGSLDRYYGYMLRKYGQAEIDRLERLKGETVKYVASDYEEIAQKYKQKTKELVGNV